MYSVRQGLRICLASLIVTIITGCDVISTVFQLGFRINGKIKSSYYNCCFIVTILVSAVCSVCTACDKVNKRTAPTRSHNITRGSNLLITTHSHCYLRETNLSSTHPPSPNLMVSITPGMNSHPPRFSGSGGIPGTKRS